MESLLPTPAPFGYALPHQCSCNLEVTPCVLNQTDNKNPSDYNFAQIELRPRSGIHDSGLREVVQLTLDADAKTISMPFLSPAWFRHPLAR
jgi:hypothetical protein